MEHNNSYVSNKGVRVQVVSGEPQLCVDDIRTILCAEVAKLPKEARPMVTAAGEARAAIDILTKDLGGQIDDFRAKSKKHLEDLRGLKFATVAEVTAMKKELADMRTFFLGADHDREIVRLREFVDLCERIAKLKSAGVLDAVADTVLKLA